MNKNVIAESSGHHMVIMVTDRFNQHFLNGSFVYSTYLCCNCLNFFQETVKTIFYNILRNLIFHCGSRRSGSLGVDKCKRTVVSHFSYNI
mgnify:CR=1 FL=1